MHHKTPKFDNPNLQRYFEKAAKRDHHSDHLYRRALHVIERFIATLAILALALVTLELCIDFPFFVIFLPGILVYFQSFFIERVFKKYMPEEEAEEDAEETFEEYE